MPVCPTCTKPNCGNHAACARRKKEIEWRGVEARMKIDHWCADWKFAFSYIAKMDSTLRRVLLDVKKTEKVEVSYEKGLECLHKTVDKLGLRPDQVAQALHAVLAPRRDNAMKEVHHRMYGPKPPGRVFRQHSHDKPKSNKPRRGP